MVAGAIVQQMLIWGDATRIEGRPKVLREPDPGEVLDVKLRGVEK
jgi:hypothetical protein